LTRPVAAGQHPPPPRGQGPAPPHREGLSQEAFADLAKLHLTCVGSIERGEQNLSLANIERVAATLGISLAELFTPFDAKPASPS
jgi:transcriptional regulator with XRE-family HTH domain